jgi:cell division protein FtsB
MSATRSYAPSNVDDPSALPSDRRRAVAADPEVDQDPSEGRSGDDPTAPDTAAATPQPDGVDLAGLAIVGITRRRVAWVSATLVAVWIVVLFARQVGDAQAAANRATQLAADNAALAGEVAALQKELDLIVKPEYVGMEARGKRFGSPKEIPFTLDPSVPSPVDGAPGSASVRLGAQTDRQTPLESWLSLLFGPTG